MLTYTQHSLSASGVFKIAEMRLLVFVPLLILSDSFPVEEHGNEETYVEPEYLDILLKEGRMDEFNRLVGIEFPHQQSSQSGLSNGDISLGAEEREQVGKELKFLGSSEARLRRTVSNSISDGNGLFDGDMLLTPTQMKELQEGEPFSHLSLCKWPKEISADYRYVPYSTSSTFSNEEKRRIQVAIDIWNLEFDDCIRYAPRKAEKDYVYFYPGTGRCFSKVGKVGGMQSIALTRKCVYKLGTILHEMTHAFGFTHEHNRPDRDQYINVLWDNIPSGEKQKYAKKPDKYEVSEGYDYYSLMHYSPKAPKSKNSRAKAFEVLDPDIDHSRVGQRDCFTDKDKRKIRKSCGCSAQRKIPN